MPQIQNRAEAEAVVRLIDSGALTGEARDLAVADLREFAEMEKAAPGPRASRGSVLAKGAREIAAGVARIPIGAGQAASAVADFVGAKGTLRNYNEAAEQFLADVRGGPKATGVERVAEFAAGAATSPTAKARGLAQTVKTISGTSVLGAVTQYDPEAASLADKSGSAALGSLAGIGLSGTLATLQFGAKNLPGALVRFVNKQVDPAQQQAAEELMSDFPKLRELLPIAARTGSVKGAQQQTSVAGNYALKTYREIANTLKDGLEEYGDRYGARWSPDEVAAHLGPRGEVAIRKAVTDLTDIKNKEWNAAMDSAKAAITTERIAARGVTGAEQAAIPVGDLETRLVELTEQFQISKNQLAPSLQRFRREAAAFNGNVSLETLVDTLQKANSDNWSLAKGLTDEQQHAFGKQVRQMLFGIVDDADPQVSDAVTWLKRAREGYGQRARQVAALRGSKVAKVLGLDTPNPSPQDAFESMVRADRGTQALFRETLEKHDPELLRAAKQLWWKQIMNDASALSTGSGASPAFDPVAFAENMLETAGRSDDAVAGLFTKAEAAQIRNVLKNVRAVNFGFGGFNARGPDGENIVMVMSNPAQSQSAPFKARLLWRMFGSEKFEKALFTQEGRARLMRVLAVKDKPELTTAVSRFMTSETDSLTKSFQDEPGE